MSRSNSRPSRDNSTTRFRKRGNVRDPHQRLRGGDRASARRQRIELPVNVSFVGDAIGERDGAALHRKQTIGRAVLERDIGQAIDRLERPLRGRIVGRGLRGARPAAVIEQQRLLPAAADAHERRAGHFLELPMAARPFRLAAQKFGTAGGLQIERCALLGARRQPIESLQLELHDRRDGRTGLLVVLE